MSSAAHTSRNTFLAAFCGSLLLPLVSHAADSSAPVQAGWKTQEIRYSYLGYTSAYDCDAAEDRIRAILLALGAHQKTRVSAQGCIASRPSRNFFITITTATPVPVADLPKTPTSQDELLKRLGVASAQLGEPFPAEWKTVALSRDRKLDLEPGDCELMEGLRDHVLPKLSVKVQADTVQCVPHAVSIKTPELTVSALMPMAKPDAAADKTKS